MLVHKVHKTINSTTTGSLKIYTNIKEQLILALTFKLELIKDGAIVQRISIKHKHKRFRRY